MSNNDCTLSHVMLADVLAMFRKKSALNLPSHPWNICKRMEPTKCAPKNYYYNFRNFPRYYYQFDTYKNQAALG